MTTAPKLSPHSPLEPEPALDESSLNAIRSILTDQDVVTPNPVQNPKRVASPAVQGQQNASLPRRKADGLPDLLAPAEHSADEAVGKSRKSTKAAKAFKRWFPVRGGSASAPSGHIRPTLEARPAAAQDASGGLVAHIKSYRPKKSHLALASLALIIFFRPWLVIGLALIAVFITFGVFLMVGYDGFWQGVIKAGRCYAKRRPSRAAAVHKKLDRFAVRWDAFLDRFPEGTVDGFYLPDFGQLDTAEARHDAALNRRLAGLSGKQG
jgi:hypothetical protein